MQYRVRCEDFGEYQLYYPQYKDWLFWRYIRDGYAESAIYRETLDEAIEDITKFKKEQIKPAISFQNIHQ